VAGSSGDTEALAEMIDRKLSEANVPVQSVETRSRMLNQVERLTTPILLLLVAMAGLFAVVGGLGLLGTMSLNVLERIKELGTIRAIGATGATVRSIVLVEAMTVAAISWLLGSLLAMPLGWVMGYAVGVSFIKVPLEFSFAPLGPAVWLALAGLVALVSSWAPAHGASTLSVRDAIAYE
jgi:putative ABC transport system permease protein